MSSVNDVSGIPTEGKRLIIVAVVGQVLHFRIFSDDGKMVVDTDAKRLTEQAEPIEDLRKQPESLWPPHEPPESEKDRVIAAVTSIVGHTRWGESETVMEEDLLDNSESDIDEPSRAEIIVFAVFFEGGLAPLSLFLGWLLHHRAFDRFAWSGRDAAWGVVATIPLILMFLAIMRWPIGPLSGIRKFWDTEVASLLAKSSWSEIALVAISAGVGEEMLFRGVLQASFSSWFGATWGLTLTSVLFGLLHPISIPYVVLKCIIGFYLGSVWIFSGNLLTVMVVHALYEFAALGYLIRLRPLDGADPNPH